MSSTKDILLVLLVGAAIGFTNGVGVAFFGISPLVMTLGMNSILQGVSLIYSSGSPVGEAPSIVTTISTGWWHQIPYVVFLWFALTIVVTLVLVFSTFGRGVYAIGAHRRASALSGLPVRRNVVLGYVVSALAATVGGMLLVGYSGQAYLGQGDEYLLPAIAVVVIGGTSIFGGKGSYIQTVAGALLITVIESILVTVNVNQSGQDILYGAIILTMAYVNQVALGDRGRMRALSGRLGAFRGWLEPARRRHEADIPRSDPTEGS